MKLFNCANLSFLLYYPTMKEVNRELSFSIAKTINDIPRQEWDSLFGKELIESYGYLKTLQDNGVEEFSFGYLVGKKNDNTILILPFFIMNFSFAMLLPQFLHKISGAFNRWLKVKALFLGSPTTEGFSMGISANEDSEAVLNEALKELEAFSKEEGIAGMIFYNLSSKDLKLAEYLKRKKFLGMETLPTTAINIEANSLEEYIQGLGKNTRKDLRKKLRRSQEISELKTEPREDIADIINNVYGLYLNNFNDADINFEILTKYFFLNICSNMPGVAKYFITYDKGKIVAFNLCLIKNGIFIDKFIGFDYEVAHKYHLYYTTFCHNIDWCIKNGLKTYQPGFSDYHPKVRLGAKLIPLYVFVKTFNTFLSLSLKILKPLIEPKNMDPVLKQIEKQKGRAILGETSHIPENALKASLLRRHSGAPLNAHQG